jgi:hypothetical protein
MYDFTPLQLFYSAFRCPATWTPAGVGAGRVGVGVVRLIITAPSTEDTSICTPISEYMDSKFGGAWPW